MPYLTISPAQLLLIGNSALLIVCLGCRIELCKDFSNELDHTGGVRNGQPVVRINGIVRGSEEAEYVLAAKKGQRVIIRLTSSPARSSVFQILDPDNETLSLAQGNYDLLGTLPKSGDYLITVSRPKQSKGTSRYKMTVTIR